MSPAWKPPAPPGQARQLTDGLGLRAGTAVLVFAERRWRPARVSPSTHERINRRSVPVTFEQNNGLSTGKVVTIEWVAATSETRWRPGYEPSYLDEQPAPDSAP